MRGGHCVATSLETAILVLSCHGDNSSSRERRRGATETRSCGRGRRSGNNDSIARRDGTRDIRFFYTV